MNRYVWRLALVCLACGPGAFARADEPACSACIRSDGAWLDEHFDGPALPDGWALPPGGRKDIAFTNGHCVFRPGPGDNYIVLPFLQQDLDQDFVIEIVFRIPAPVAGPYSLFQMAREGGSFQLILAPAGPEQRLTLDGAADLGIVRPGGTCTVAVLCRPDGSYAGTLEGPGIERPVRRVLAGADGALNALHLGNEYGAGVGSVAVDRIRIGRPVCPDRRAP